MSTRRTMTKKTKKKSRSKLIKELDSVFSKYIRMKYAFDGKVQCKSCGKIDDVKNMQNGHYISRQHYSTRWVEKNCHPQCVGCNIFKNGNYPEYSKFMIEAYGVEVIDELIALSKQVTKFSRGDLESMIEKYKLLIK